MSTLARQNGWHGFDNLGEKVKGGWYYYCDGMPSPMGCGQTMQVSRRWTTVGKKKGGWVVTYGLEPETDTTPYSDTDKCHPDEDVVLTFCPSCVVLGRVNTP